MLATLLSKIWNARLLPVMEYFYIFYLLPPLILTHTLSPINIIHTNTNYVTQTSDHTMHRLLNNWHLGTFWSNVVSSQVALLRDEQVLHPPFLPPVSTQVKTKESMEGDAEESDEDKPTLLWERCIQQSIFVDLSEDESLHLSDLETSLALRLSQTESAASEASIHLSGESWSHLLTIKFFVGC